MNAPLKLSLADGMDPAAFARLSQLAGDPLVARMLANGFNARNEDPAVARLMGEVQGLSPRQRHTLLSSQDGTPHLMGLASGDVHIPTGLPNQFVLYENRDMIADSVLPVVSVNKLSDKVWAAPVNTLQTIANAQMAGSRGRPNEVPYSVSSTLSYTCESYGLVDFIDYQMLANADSPIEPRVLSAIVVKSFLDLARESRVAGVVFNASNYGANTAALSGANRWDNAASDPIQEILTQREAIFSTPNTLVIGGQVWPKLRTHPKVLQYILSRAGVSNLGAVPLTVQLELFAALCEVERVVVGRAKYVTSQEAGSTAAYLWGKSCALIRVEPNPNPRMTQTFGYTYRFGSKSYRNEIIPDRMPGQMGGEYLKLTHADAEVAIGGATTGYFWDTVIS